MIQLQRVSTTGASEVWYLHAAIHKLYQLAEAHCIFEYDAGTAYIEVFVAENCPRYKDLIDYFVDQVIPCNYAYMVQVYTRGMLIDTWSSAQSSSDESDTADSPYDKMAYLLGFKTTTSG